MSTAQIGNAWNDTALDDGLRADLLLAALTTAEKIAQLGSIWPQEDADPDAAGASVAPMQDSISDEKTLNERIAHGIGQITRAYGTGPVSPAEGLERLRSLQGRVVDAQRFGVPAIAHEECLTGVATLTATAYPTPLAWGASFNPGLVEEMATRIGGDLRSAGIHQGLAPVLDVARDYRWGRVEETMGEDPHLVSVMGTAYVRGLESTGLIATLKHFAAYSASRGGRNHAPVSIGPRELADVMLPPFEAALGEGGARSVMNSYTDIDGVPVASDARLLRHLLRDLWGFTGTVVSDYWAIPFLHSTHGVAADEIEAGVLALRAGIDVELPFSVSYADGLAAVAATDPGLGELIDVAVRRVLLQKVQLGLLDPDHELVPSSADALSFDSAENRDVARRLAEESVVLLENGRGTLPLDPAPTERIALLGPIFGDPVTLLGCYAFPNHVLSAHPGADPGLPIATLRTAIAEEFPTVQFAHAAGPSILGGAEGGPEDSDALDAALALATSSDLAILAVGDRSGLFGAGTSGEGCDAYDLALPGRQDELIERILETGTRVVLIVVSGRPYALGRYTGRVDAILQAFLPGVEGASAISGVLSGRVEPSGRLPVQIPHDRRVFSTYLQPRLGRRADGITVVDPTPAFPFGHGLGYGSTDWASVGPRELTVAVDGTIDVDVRVTNTGGRAASEVVQVYLQQQGHGVVLPERRLIAFAKTVVAPEASTELRFEIPTDLTSYTDADLTRVVTPGPVRLVVARSAEDEEFAIDVTLTGTMRRLGFERQHRARVTERHQDRERRLS
ncbi:beta-glucosidase [Pseudoclavibacter terrae]|uniref:beta-glucosidase n=1 Tax=Pseudoclavibacter terrae TaxID=1530195 RepID=UPI00232FCCB1|nr:glycoside hydrolase family 3 N-terminal domain-containing protein [Pseudoclavibacter terrae]